MAQRSSHGGLRLHVLDGIKLVPWAVKMALDLCEPGGEVLSDFQEAVMRLAPLDFDFQTMVAGAQRFRYCQGTQSEFMDWEALVSLQLPRNCPEWFPFLKVFAVSLKTDLLVLNMVGEAPNWFVAFFSKSEKYGIGADLLFSSGLELDVSQEMKRMNNKAGVPEGHHPRPLKTGAEELDRLINLTGGLVLKATEGGWCKCVRKPRRSIRNSDHLSTSPRDMDTNPSGFHQGAMEWDGTAVQESHSSSSAVAEAAWKQVDSPFLPDSPAAPLGDVH